MSLGLVGWNMVHRQLIMPHRVSHRGAAPGDENLFGPEALPRLRQALGDLNWLLSRGYAHASSLELVGNRFSLRERQRLAIGRCACADAALARRTERQLAPADMRGKCLWLDGYNVLMAVEAALGGGVVLLGRDGCCRDVLGIHGSYHRVQETEPALKRIGERAARLGIPGCHWWLDKPVSNSGRLKAFILDVAATSGWRWEVSLELNPDRVLMESREVIATADSAILDQCGRWMNLARETIEHHVSDAWLIDLTGS